MSTLPKTLRGKRARPKSKMLDRTFALCGRHVVRTPTVPEPEHPIGGRHGDPELTKHCPEWWHQRCPERWPERCPFFSSVVNARSGDFRRQLGLVGTMPANPLWRLLGQPRTRQANSSDTNLPNAATQDSTVPIL